MNGAATESATPAVSVIIPAYNEAATIGAAIDSVIAQHFTDFELLVIDDGSTDRTAEIAREHADHRTAIHSFANQGLAASRNRGIRKARGRYIAFLDADDLWLPDKLARQHRILSEQQDAALVYSWTDCISEQGEFLRHGSHVCCAGHVYDRLLSRNFLDNGSSAMVRARIFDDIGLFNEDYPAGEDWDMWLRIAWRYPLACSPHPDVLYRVRQTSMMSNVDRQFECMTTILATGLERMAPSADTDRIRVAATANMCRFLTVRLVETAAGHSAGRQAARYWWQFISTTPERLRQGGKAILLAPLIVAMLVLPAAWYRPLRDGAVAFYSRLGSNRNNVSQ